MTRERLLWLGVGLAMLVLLGALIDGAIRAVEREEALRQQIIADRVFDEMERELAALVDREEGRPFLHYSYTFVPDNDAGPGGISRSPLAELPSEPAVVGYFQLNPDGSLSTPHRPRRGETVNPVAAVEDTEERLARATAGLTGLTAESPRPPPKQVAKKRRPANKPKTPKGALGSLGSTADALSSLNRGLNTVASTREPVQEKVQLLQAGNFANNGDIDDFEAVFNTVQLQLDNAQQAAPQQAVQQQAPQQMQVPQAVQQQVEQNNAPALPVLADPVLPMVTLPIDLPTEEEVEVTIAPFALYDDAGSLVLYRTVKLGENRWVQGLVLDRAAWIQTLENAVIGAEIAPLTTLSWDGDGDYGHTFRAPFDTLAVGLTLDMPPRQSTSWFWALAAILVGVVGIAGLVASRWLRESRRLAQQRADFVAAVSHELRSPLTSIRMYSEMLEQGMVGSDDQRVGYYQTIRQESERLGRLVEDVLAFSKLERGQETEGTSGTLGDVVDDVARMFRPITERNGFAWTVEVADDARGATVSDRDALAQILTNLVDNAMKFSYDREVRQVEVTARRADTGVELAVRDRGPGVDPAFLPRIFEAFTRGEAELTRKTKGTGIGLALVRGLADRLGGAVRARNLPDGFEVVLSLPDPV